MGHPKTTLTSKGERGITQMSTKLWAIHKPREHLGVEKEGKKILIVVKVARLGGGQNSEKNGYVVCAWCLK